MGTSQLPQGLSKMKMCVLHIDGRSIAGTSLQRTIEKYFLKFYIPSPYDPEIPVPGIYPTTIFAREMSYIHHIHCNILLLITDPGNIPNGRL
jgi:hypothetical protein